MIVLADTLHDIRVMFDVDETGHTRVQIEAGLHDVQIIGKTPETEEQLTAMMQLLGKKIWQHHVRQTSPQIHNTKVE